MLPRPVTSIKAWKVRPDRRVELPEQVATEEPLQIQAAGPCQEPQEVAVTMRTPGHDFELAVGLLLSEGLILRGEIDSVGYCQRLRQDDDPATRYNTVTVTLNRPVPKVAERALPISSSCGVCGKTSIDQIKADCRVVPFIGTLPADLIPSLPERLRTAQKAFDLTGGLHAAGLFDPSGELWVAREDVGRHNAVDKVIGFTALKGGLPSHLVGGLAGWVLMVSGRVSFEIVQKTAQAGIGTIAAVSAPTSLAVRAATELGVTLAAFVRGDSYNVYAHPERLDDWTTA